MYCPSRKATEQLSSYTTPAPIPQPPPLSVPIGHGRELRRGQLGWPRQFRSQVGRRPRPLHANAAMCCVHISSAAVDGRLPVHPRRAPHRRSEAPIRGADPILLFRWHVLYSGVYWAGLMGVTAFREVPVVTASRYAECYSVHEDLDVNITFAGLLSLV